MKERMGGTLFTDSTPSSSPLNLSWSPSPPTLLGSVRWNSRYHRGYLRREYKPWVLTFSRQKKPHKSWTSPWRGIFHPHPSPVPYWDSPYSSRRPEDPQCLELSHTTCPVIYTSTRTWVRSVTLFLYSCPGLVHCGLSDHRNGTLQLRCQCVCRGVCDFDVPPLVTPRGLSRTHTTLTSWFLVLTTFSIKLTNESLLT